MALKTSQSGMECWLYTTVICEIPSWQKGGDRESAHFSILPVM